MFESIPLQVFYDKLAVTSKHVLMIIVTGRTVSQILYILFYYH